VFSDSLGHVTNVSPMIIEETSKLIKQFMGTNVDKKRLQKLGNIAQQPMSIRCCVYNYLEDSSSSVWTKEHPRFYACRACANTQRPCMLIVGSLVFVLPLHPAPRERDPEDGEEDPDDDMLDYTAAADPPLGLDTWILPSTMKNITRLTGVYAEKNKDRSDGN
jgi:hypothetical protein